MTEQARSWRPWTARDERLLVKHYVAGCLTAETARILKRSVRAVERRASDLRARGIPVPRAERVQPDIFLMDVR